MHEAYCRVIDLIDAGTIDHRAISMALAKANPVAFLAIHDHVGGHYKTDKQLLDEELLAIMNSPMATGSSKVVAIKRCRELAGIGLKEAKDYVDALEATSKAAVTTTGSVDSLKTLLIDLLGKQEADDIPAKYDDEGAFR